MILFLCLFLVLLTGNAIAQYCDTNPRIITGTVTWPANTSITCAGSVYVLGGTLTIEEGAVVHMPSSATLYVGKLLWSKGTLNIEGDSGSPVEFVPSDTDYRWDAIRLTEDSEDNYIEYLQMEGCGSGHECLAVNDTTGSTTLHGIHIHKYLNAYDTTHENTGLALQDAASVSVDDIYIDGFETGISIEGSTASPQAFTNILVWDNDVAVLIDDGSEVSISESCIYGNDATGILVADGKLTMDDTQVYANAYVGMEWSGNTYHTGVFFSQYADTSSVVSPDNEIWLNYPSGFDDYNAEMINKTGTQMNAQSNEFGCDGVYPALSNIKFDYSGFACH